MFKKIFKKKAKNKAKPQQVDEGEEVFNSNNFLMLDTKEMESMSNEELVQIIFRYDSELKNSHQTLNEKTNLEVEYNSMVASNAELQTQLEITTQENEGLQKCLEEKSLELTSLNTELAVKQVQATKFAQDVESLQYQLVEMKRVLEEEANRSPSSGSEQLNAEIIALRAKTLEIPSLQEQVKNVSVSNRLLAKEKEDLESQLTATQAQLDQTTDKLHCIERERQELELQCYRQQMEVNADKRDVESFEMYKHKYEAEILQLKDRCNAKDRKLQQKKLKLASANKEIGSLKTDLSSVEHKYAILQSTSELEIKKLKDQFESDTKYKAEIHATTNRALEKDLQERNQQLQQLQDQLKEYRTKIQQHEPVEIVFSAKETALQVRISELESLLRKSEATNKEDAARIGKLENDLTREVGSRPVMTEPIAGCGISGESAGVGDYAILPLMKSEFEQLYKHLMKIMMTAEIQSTPGRPARYMMDTNEFSILERRLNDVVMAVHEICEGIQVAAAVPKAPASFGSSNRSASADKKSASLFTCLTGTGAREDTDTRRIPGKPPVRRPVDPKRFTFTPKASTESKHFT